MRGGVCISYIMLHLWLYLLFLVLLEALKTKFKLIWFGE